MTQFPMLFHKVYFTVHQEWTSGRLSYTVQLSDLNFLLLTGCQDLKTSPEKETDYKRTRLGRGQHTSR